MDLLLAALHKYKERQEIEDKISTIRKKNEDLSDQFKKLENEMQVLREENKALTEKILKADAELIV